MHLPLILIKIVETMQPASERIVLFKEAIYDQILAHVLQTKSLWHVD